MSRFNTNRTLTEVISFVVILSASITMSLFQPRTVHVCHNFTHKLSTLYSARDMVKLYPSCKFLMREMLS